MTDNEIDPFGLKDGRAIYELSSAAGNTFDRCEGVFNQLLATDPDISWQYRRAARQSEEDGLKTVILPTVHLDGLPYRMMREEGLYSTSFSFNRADAGYEESGFIVEKDVSGAAVYRSSDIPSIDKLNDEEKKELVASTKSWIESYAQGLGVQPENLLTLAKQKARPYGLTASIRKTGSRAVKVAKSSFAPEKIRLGKKIAAVGLAAVAISSLAPGSTNRNPSHPRVPDVTAGSADNSNWSTPGVTVSNSNHISVDNDGADVTHNTRRTSNRITVTN